MGVGCSSEHATTSRRLSTSGIAATCLANTSTSDERPTDKPNSSRTKVQSYRKVGANRTQVSNDYYACGEGRARGGKRGAQAGRGSTCGDEIRAYYATCYPERCTRTLAPRRRRSAASSATRRAPWRARGRARHGVRPCARYGARWCARHGAVQRCARNGARLLHRPECQRSGRRARLALCAPDTGKGCPSARRVVRVRARTKLGYPAGVPNPRLEPRCVRVWHPERRPLPTQLAFITKEKSPRTQLCVKWGARIHSWSAHRISLSGSPRCS